MMPFYRLLLIFILIIAVGNSAVLKPSNKKFKIVKISDENKKTRTYYHLKKDQNMVFKNLDNYVDDANANYSIKVITRAKISPNSNSSKTFGVELNILEDGVERNRILKYKKGVSTAKKSSKSGFNFTKAGFWFDEIRNIKDSEILIKLVDGSPELDVRVVINKIDYRTADETLSTVNREKSYKIHYKKDESDSTYMKSKGWYMLNEDDDLQFKVSGPKQIRIFSRTADLNELENQFYSFSLRENGKYINEYFFESALSNQDAHIIIEDNKIVLSSYNSFFFNVPKGIHYYTIKIPEDDAIGDIFLKIQSYKDK